MNNGQLDKYKINDNGSIGKVSVQVSNCEILETSFLDCVIFPMSSTGKGADDSKAPATQPELTKIDPEKTKMRAQLIKLKRIAQLYKDEVAKYKKALADARLMITKLKDSLVNMKEQQKKQQQQFKQKLLSNSRKDTVTDVLRGRRPNEIIVRVRHASEHWCLVQFEGNDDDDDDDDEEDEKGNEGSGVKMGQNNKTKTTTKDDPDRYRWIRQNILETQAYEQYGLRLDIPEVAFDASMCVNNNEDNGADGGGSGGNRNGGNGNNNGGRSVSGMQEELDQTQSNLDRVQEDYRRYRVRSEIQKKQQETELNRVMQANLAFQQRRIAGDDGINAKLRASEAKTDDLHVELKNQSKIVYKTKIEMERIKKENAQLIQLLETGNRRRDSEGIVGRFKELQKEYDAYKTRASDALKHKDAAIKRALESNGTNNNHRNNKGSKNQSTGGAPRVLPKNPTTEYLKNTIIQYMATDQVEVKEHMEAAIATVLQFTNDDIQFLKQKRDDSQGWVSSLFG